MSFKQAAVPFFANACPGIIGGAVVLSLTLASIAAGAQDICTGAGRAKMRAAKVTEPEIWKRCPADAIADAVDYRGDLKSIVFDGQRAVGKAVQLEARYQELGLHQGQPTMTLFVDTDTSLTVWHVRFDSRMNDRVREIKKGQRVKINCEIMELSSLVSYCQLVKLY